MSVHIDHCNFLADQTIHQSIAAVGLSDPNAVAVVCQDTFLTYYELNSQAERFASLLYYSYPSLMIEGMRIALCMERSAEMFIGILSILKIGGAYVPIDSKYPMERIRFVLKDSGCQIILMDSSSYETFKQGLPADIHVVLVDKELLSFVAEPDDSIKHQNIPEALRNSSPYQPCYVMYTSGTTGSPKGVMISHRSVYNYFQNVKKYLVDIERIDFSTSIAFDLSVTTTLLPLLCGKTIVVYSGELIDVESYIKHLQKTNIDFIKSTPSYLMQVFSESDAPWVKRCFVGGEKLTNNQLDVLCQHVGELYDEYGPTEATVGVFLQQKDQTTRPIARMGKPYSNCQTYVLDGHLKPVLTGGVGELYLGGEVLALGYLNQPEHTLERFIPNPFGQGRLYKTGDLVRILAEGELEYMGRNDSQVKIRGFRVELEEVEQRLLLYPLVQQACVLVYGQEETRQLVGFYQSKTPLDNKDILDYLSVWLPDYMIPSTLWYSPQFPLTLNGKVNKEALLHLITERKVLLLSKLSQTQHFVIQLMHRLLPTQNLVTLEDNFFSLGGHSLIITTLIHEIKKIYNCFISPSEIYRAENLADIAVLIDTRIS